MKRVLFVQVSHSYSDNIFLPYAAGRLWASLKCAAPEQFELAKFATGRPAGFVFLRENPEMIVQELAGPPDIVLVSCYMWNEQWNRQFAQALHQRFPDTKLVAGGPQIPARKQDITDEFKFYNVLVRGEGENLIKSLLNDLIDQTYFSTHQIQDLGELPSPYLTGVYDEIYEHPAYKGINWTAYMETHRGCPYRCAFCAWHGMLDKIKDFSLETIFAELQWFSDHRIAFVFNCDVNFGIRPAVAEAIVDRLVELKTRTGFPQRFNTAWAKAHAKVLLPMNQKLAAAKLLKGTTLSLQSTDSNVLKNVNRQDKAVEQFKADVALYDAAKVPTYTELIIGLPGETLETFAHTLEFLLESGRHDGLIIYPCVVLPGSKLSIPEYRQEHGIETIRTLPILNHGKPDTVQEYCTVVTATKTMPAEDVIQAFLLGWAIQTFHHMGFFRDVGIRLYQDKGIRYIDAYPVLAKCWSRSEFYEATARAFYSGRSPEGVDLFEIQWHLEEAAFIDLVMSTTEVEYQRLCGEWLNRLGVSNLVALDELHTYWERIVKPNEFPSPEEYATQIVWYGRKGGASLRPAV